MKTHVHRTTRRRIRRLFRVGLKPAEHGLLLDELDRCEACTGFYRRHHALEAALCGSGSGPTPFAIERVKAAVLQAASEPGRQAPATSRWWIWAPVAGLALAAVVLLLVPGVGSPQRVPVPKGAELEPVTLIARGAAPAETADVGIRVFRLAAAGQRVQERPVLVLGDVITFTYTNLSERVKYLALFGVQAGGAVRWYYPGYGGRESIPILVDRMDEPLVDGIRLSVNHVPGWLRIVAVFSDEPLDTDTLEASLQELAVTPDAVKSLKPLYLLEMDVLEHSFLVEIATSSE